MKLLSFSIKSILADCCYALEHKRSELSQDRYLFVIKKDKLDLFGSAKPMLCCQKEKKMHIFTKKL